MNHFDNLPSEIQEKIFKYAHNSQLSECMKELPTSKVLEKVAGLRKPGWAGGEYYWWWVDHKYEYRPNRPYWMIDLRAKEFTRYHESWISFPETSEREVKHYYRQREGWHKDRTTETHKIDLKNHLIANGFKGVSKLKKYELIKLCMSF